ncbi:hypothetical protein PG984_003568 [Apiospora sp. TS-2023a]
MEDPTGIYSLITTPFYSGDLLLTYHINMIHERITMTHPNDTKQTVQQTALGRNRLLRLPVAQLYNLDLLPAREMQKVADHLQPLLLADP